MKFVLYGLPCSGKTTLLDKISIPVIHGSKELQKISGGKFDSLDNDEKENIRRQYAKRIKDCKKDIISDGHYSFGKEVVFTQYDADAYDVFIYLYCQAETICSRIKKSEKNHKFAELSSQQITDWQSDEIENLRRECHLRNKDFYVVKDITPEKFQAFIDKIKNGFSSVKLAEKITDRILSFYPEPCELCITDGDKTLSLQDTFKTCTNGYISKAFDGNFYTGYQSLEFTEEIKSVKLNKDKLKYIKLNQQTFQKISGKNYVVLSSGLYELWNEFARLNGLENVIADTEISADTKYFVVKFLQEKGYKITAFGDSKNDLYMLKKADKGYIVMGNYLSSTLVDYDLSELNLLYFKDNFILSENNPDKEIKENISICKSDSGINGNNLAKAHFKLGVSLGNHIKRFIPSVNTAVICLERSARLFCDGIYFSFGGTFYSIIPEARTFPEIKEKNVIIVDAVINTGKSVSEVISKLKKQNSEKNIFIAVNVIQENALELFNEYKLFAVRKSKNSFKGANQNFQKDGKGPDTADRLFNYIND